MPIRFRCTYCDKLLGIALRKAGQEVTCPKCKGRMRVPKAEAASKTVAVDPQRDSQKTLNFHAKSSPAPDNRNAREYPVPAKLFENDDFDRMLGAGTLPTPNGEGAANIPTTSPIEKLAKESLANDRELFAIDLDAPPLAQIDNGADEPDVGRSGKKWPLLVATAVVFFALGLAAGYFLRR